MAASNYFHFLEYCLTLYNYCFDFTDMVTSFHLERGILYEPFR